MESAERRERLDNLELVDLLEDGDDLETMDPKETLYDTFNAMHPSKHPHKDLQFFFHQDILP